MIRTAGISAGLAVLLITGSAGADTGPELLEQAQAAHREIEYGKARELLQQSLRAGDHDPTSLAELYAWSGRIAAAFGRADEAYDDYRRMLILRPGSSLPDGLAPKIVAPFQRARLAVEDSGGVELRVARATATTLTVAVSSDPVGMVAGVEARFGGDRTARGELDGDVALVVIPEGAGERVRIRAVDRFGNWLAELDWRRPAAGETRERAPGTGERTTTAPASAGMLEAEASGPGQPLYARWQLWGAAAVGAAATAVYCGLRARADWAQLDEVIENSGSYHYDDARRLQSSGRRNQLFANIGTAAALGLAGVSLYLKVRGDGTERSGLGATVGAGGASVTWGGSF